MGPVGRALVAIPLIAGYFFAVEVPWHERQHCARSGAPGCTWAWTNPLAHPDGRIAQAGPLRGAAATDDHHEIIPQHFARVGVLALAAVWWISRAPN